MTLGQIAVGLTLLLVAASLGGFLVTGNLMLGMGLLAAPLPCLAVFSLNPEWADRTLRETRLRNRRDGAVEAGLDRALRPPVGPVSVEDDGAFFVPGCPTLATGARQPGGAVTRPFPIEPPDGDLASTPPASR